MTTITFEEDLKIAKTSFVNFSDFREYIIHNSYYPEIPELEFIGYNDLNIEDKKLFDGVDFLDKTKFTNI